MSVKLTTSTIYLGNKVGGIINMPFDIVNGYLPSGVKTKEEIPELYNLFDLYLESPEIKKFPYLFAVTANKFQTNSLDVLKKHGFREVVEFYSAHERKDETLSLLTKTQENINFDFEKADLGICNQNFNCSVGMNRESYIRCIITSQNPGETFEFLKNKEFSRVKNTPIWFKIDKKFIIPKKK